MHTLFPPHVSTDDGRLTAPTAAACMLVALYARHLFEASRRIASTIVNPTNCIADRLTEASYVRLCIH